jgi:transposase-like protein
MSMVSHLHHFFNAETCQSSLHTLRWKDRPLQCPRCQSLNVGPWGAYHAQPGLQRYRCKEQGCKRTFNDLTGTLLDGSKRSVMHWILAKFLLCLSCSSRRIARELGVHGRTSYRWCWWLRNAALSYELHRQLEGTVEADDLYHTAGHKGQATHGGKKVLGRRARGRRKKREPGRGHYDKDRPAIIAWVSRQGAVVIQATRDFTVQTQSRRRPTSPSKRAVGSIRTPPAAIGRSRAMRMTSSIIPRRNTRGVTSMKIGPSVCSRCSSPTCGYFEASARRPYRATWASFNSCATCMRRWTLPSRAERGGVILSDAWTTSICYKPREIERTP